MRTLRHFAIFGVVLIGGWLAVSAAWAQLPPPSANDNSGGGFPFGGSNEPVVRVSAQFAVAAEGRPARLYIAADVKPEWHIYSLTQPKGGPLATEIRLDPANTYRLLGEFQPSPTPTKGTEDVYPGLTIESHSDRVVWHVPIELNPSVDPAKLQITGSVYAMACNTACLPPQDYRFVATLGQGFPVEAAQSAATGDTSATAPVDNKTLSAVLVAALLGGLILNLMPCVLPVISLKLLAFVEQGGHSRGRVFALNLWYSAGLILVFLVLATLSASFSLAWGEQFTRTWFKVSITALVFVLALSFLGVWEIPIPGFVGSGKAGKLQAKEGAAGAFAKGVFTTILATPCIGPFLGTVFGFTLNQPAYVIYLIFGAAGVGMALPYLLLSLFPELARLLPKPGEWMETLKEVMGFLLLATVVYLFTSINESYFIPTLSLLVGLWFACWLIGRTPLTATPGRRATVWLGGAIPVVAVVLLGFTNLFARPKLPWQEFSPAALQEARADGKTVMVDFTANWCPNCQVNLGFAINTSAVKQLVAKNDVVPLVADWTDYSPTIKDFLVNKLQRQAIPVLAIWPAGAEDAEVMILDGLLTQGDVLAALEEAGPSRGVPAEPPSDVLPASSRKSDVARIAGS